MKTQRDTETVEVHFVKHGKLGKRTLRAGSFVAVSPNDHDGFAGGWFVVEIQGEDILLGHSPGDRCHVAFLRNSGRIS